MTQYVLTAASWLNFGAIINYFKDVRRNYINARKVSDTIKELSRLSDAELRDIGIHRGDIHAIAMETQYDNIDKVEFNRNLRGWV
jgi:uncharacterized protein YjiS (DUF1127 family)